MGILEGDNMKGKRVVACGPFYGELGWSLSGWSGAIRHVAFNNEYKDREFLVMDYAGRYPIYHDFATLVPLPTWFTSAGLQQASYDVVGMNPDLYSKLIKYFRRFYEDADDVYEIRPPRGHTFEVVDGFTQNWVQLKPTMQMRSVREVMLNQTGMQDKDIVVVMPRHRKGVGQHHADGNLDTSFSDSRNWPPPYWQELIVNLLKMDVCVVISGTRDGVPPLNIEHPNLIDLSYFDNVKLMDLTLAFMEKAMVCVSSQSGGTHLGLQAGCPSFIFGHEKQRHMVKSNPLNTAVCFFETPLPYTTEPAKIFDELLSFSSLVSKKIHKPRMRGNDEFIENITGQSLVNSNICGICGGVYSHSGVADLLRCGSCGLLKKIEVPKKEKIMVYLEQSVLGYVGNTDKQEERTKEAEFQLDMIEKHCTGRKMFDVGCASGLFMSVARGKGWTCDGNDVSKGAVVTAKDVFGVDIRYGMLEDLEIDNDYNCFVLWHTLEHTISPVSTLKFCYDHMVPGGILQVAVPLKEGQDLITRYEYEHNYEFSRDNLVKLLNKCGFEPVYEEERAPNEDTQINVIARRVG